MKLAYRNIPVLILGYNRPSHIKKLIKSLKKIKPKKIYISLDGSKKKIEDIKKCKLVKNEIDKINWNCMLKKNYNPNNLVSEARNDGFSAVGLKSIPYCSNGRSPKSCFCQTS